MSAYENSLFPGVDDLPPKSWTFTDFGPEFDVHVARHLPGYFDVQHLVSIVAQHVVGFNGVIADLGCSTGHTAESIASVLGRDVTFYLYDRDRSMIDRATERLSGLNATFARINLPAALPHRDASLTTCLWLLQFVDPTQWVPILREARRCSAPYGALLVAAKTRYPDSRWEGISNSALDDYKAGRGVSANERAEKAKSLRGVLHPATVENYAAVMEQAGWCPPVVLWRWHVWSVLGSFAAD